MSIFKSDTQISYQRNNKFPLHQRPPSSKGAELRKRIWEKVGEMSWVGKCQDSRPDPQNL